VATKRKDNATVTVVLEIEAGKKYRVIWNQLVSCPSDRIREDSAARIGVGPAEGTCNFGVGANVLADLASQIGDGGEDAASEQIALDFGKPQFHLIQPGRISRREVKVNLGMLGEELLDGLGLVGRQIIEDDVNFPRPASSLHHL